MPKSPRKTPKSKSTSITKIVNNLRKDILYGRLKPDEHLKEFRIAEIYKVSRVPIREAFRILHSEGYVKMIPNRGSYVRKVTRDYFVEYGEVYRLIGPTVLRDSIPRWNSSTYKKAYSILDKIDTSKDFNKTSHLLWDFAKTIFGKSKFEFMKSIINDIYMHNIRSIADIVYKLQNMKYDTYPHRKLLSLCKEGKNEEAVKFWFDNLAKLSESFQKFVNEQEKTN